MVKMEAAHRMKEKDVVLLSTADWDNPFWTNKQHVAVALTDRGYRVLYIDSLGLRRPSLSSRDFRRILKRLGKAVRPPRKVRENLWVWSPVTLPFNAIPAVRKLNRLLLSFGVSIWRSWLGMRRAVLWTYNPLSHELLSLKPWTRVVYHCVDEIKAQPGMPSEILARAEDELVRQASIVFVTSTTLVATRRLINPHTYYLSNVADYAHFSKALLEETTIPSDVASIRGPRIGFIGAISGYKVDFDLLRDLAEKNPNWSIVLIGEIGEGDPWTDPARLQGVANIHLLGPKPYSALPAYLKGIDVAILPNRLNEYTAAMFPMKFFEYLASGRPVVSTFLPSLSAFAGEAYFAASREEFGQAIESALAGGGASLERRLNLAKEYTYDSRTDRMLNLIEEVGI